MAVAVVTVASGGRPVVDVTATSPKLGMAVTEAINGKGIAGDQGRDLRHAGGLSCDCDQRGQASEMSDVKYRDFRWLEEFWKNRTGSG